MAFENLKKTGIKYVLQKMKTIFLQIKDAVKSVNGEEPDENGDIEILAVPYAGNLQSDSSGLNTDTFIIRTSGGSSSVENGDSWLMRVKGNSEHEGYVAEVLEMSVTPVDPESGTAIRATIDRDTFIAEVTESGTITLVYSTDWSTDPTVYGITVTGTPAAGDTIVVVYVAEERGTITPANPQSMISTGWNLYNHDTGYARVIKYDEDEGFMISGAYMALKFAATPDGTQTDISVTSGHFQVPSDGYVFVTGGNSTTTAIWMTWSDWTEEYEGEFAAYTETEADFSSVMSTYFPYGLLKAGSAVDEIDLNLGQAISRVERLAYSAANRASAAASGREYEFDENYIYLARITAVVNSVTVDGAMAVNDHGLEMFSQTDVPVEAEMLYGQNLKNKLERDVLTISGHLVDALNSSSTGKALTAKQGNVLNGKITAINTASSTSPSTQTSKVTDRGSFAFKFGSLVVVGISCEVAESVGTNTDLYSIPSGYRPAASYVTAISMTGVAGSGSQATRPSLVRITSDGKVRQTWSPTYSGWFTALFIYKAA